MTPWHRRFSASFLALGAALRLRVYLADFSLRHDEAELAINLLSRSYRGLIQPLDRAQGAPLGFLWAERLAIDLFGPGEKALRLIPLLAGLAALPIFARVARRALSPGVALLALGLFAISTWPIRYAAETKQYSSDLLTALLLLDIAWGVRDSPSIRSRIFLALSGAAGVWFSHPAVFVIAALGVWLWVEDRGSGWRTRLETWGPIGFAWGISFLAIDRISLRNLRANPDLLGFWSSAFAPFPPRSMADLKWYGNQALDVLSDPMGLSLSGLAALVFLLGIGSFRERSPRLLIPILGPILTAFAASCLGKYPFSGRLMLFAVPLGLLVVAEGLAWCRRGGMRLVGTVAVLLLIGPATNAARELLRPPPGEELRSALRAVGRESQPADPIYIYYAAEPAFTYYHTYYNPPILGSHPYIIGRSLRGDIAALDAEIVRLSKMDRVWVIFSHVVKSAGVDEEKYMLHGLDRTSRRTAASGGFGSSAYRYDRKPADPSILHSPLAASRGSQYLPSHYSNEQNSSGEE